MKNKSNKKLIDEINKLIFECEAGFKLLRAPMAATYIEGKIKYENKNKWQSRNPNRVYSTLSITKEERKKLKVKNSHELITQIMVELEMNNPLWYCSADKSQIRKGLSDLRNSNFILQIRGTNIYYVNPNYICKGDPLMVINSLAFYLDKQRRSYAEVTIDDIKRLDKPPENYTPPHYLKQQIEQMSQ